jgi:hypothetical protein
MSLSSLRRQEPLLGKRGAQHAAATRSKVPVEGVATQWVRFVHGAVFGLEAAAHNKV